MIRIKLYLTNPKLLLNIFTSLSALPLEILMFIIEIHLKVKDLTNAYTFQPKEHRI